MNPHLRQLWGEGLDWAPEQQEGSWRGEGLEAAGVPQAEGVGLVGVPQAEGVGLVGVPQIEGVGLVEVQGVGLVPRGRPAELLTLSRVHSD